MKKFLEKKLKTLTKSALKKQKPKIITITGSVGKTSTKEAIFSVLEKKFNVRRSLKNYNNEIGLPLTVVGMDSPGKSVSGWTEIFFKFIVLSLFKKKNYPDVLILEIAADKPGDLKYLMEMIPKKLLKASVLTSVSSAHLEFFGDLEGVFKEKTSPFRYLKENGFAIVNKDGCDIEKIKQKFQKNYITYAIQQPAEVTASNLRATDEGVTFIVKYHGNSAELLLKDAISTHQVYSSLAGVAVGISLGMSFSDIISGLKNYSVLPGRMRKIKGINGSLIIDDTYNSSPVAVVMALNSLVKLPLGRRRMAVLGDMLEMGEHSEELHRQIGEKVAKSKIDYLFAFGPEAKFIAEQAIESGMHKSTVHHFSGQLKLKEHLEKMLRRDDVVLIKASQGMRLEKLVKALMANPGNAVKLLVRQDETWLKK